MEAIGRRCCPNSRARRRRGQLYDVNFTEALFQRPDTARYDGKVPPILDRRVRRDRHRIPPDQRRHIASASLIASRNVVTSELIGRLAAQIPVRLLVLGIENFPPAQGGSVRRASAAQAPDRPESRFLSAKCLIGLKTCPPRQATRRYRKTLHISLQGLGSE